MLHAIFMHTIQLKFRDAVAELEIVSRIKIIVYFVLKFIRVIVISNGRRPEW